MKLSDKMPATQDSTLSARMPSTMESDAPAYSGEGGSDDAAPGYCSQTTSPGVKWECINDNSKLGWDVGSDDDKGPAWELEDRKDEGDEGALPQRDPDGDGDLN